MTTTERFVTYFLIASVGIGLFCAGNHAIQELQENVPTIFGRLFDAAIRIVALEQEFDQMQEVTFSRLIITNEFQLKDANGLTRAFIKCTPDGNPTFTLLYPDGAYAATLSIINDHAQLTAQFPDGSFQVARWQRILPESQ